jgi:general secretion pathway protein G
MNTLPASASAVHRRGLTLVEVLVVVVILALLVALLLPAINGAMRAARNAAVSAEINALAQALADFKARYGTYPPSRFLCVESGDYGPYLNDTTPLGGGTVTDPTSPGTGDITVGQLAQRSVRFLRTAFPRMSTTGGLPAGVFHDFNGDGARSTKPYVLHGHECLVLFLGGVPFRDPKTGNFAPGGLGKDPASPFSNLVMENPMYSANRQAPFYAFPPSRLALDPTSGVSGTKWVGTGIPAFMSLLVGPGGMPTPYAYFAASGGYDPNDVNFPAEADDAGNAPLSLAFAATTPVVGGSCTSPAPNPYTVGATTGGTVAYHAAQTFQIIAAGADGLFGVGGQWGPSSGDSADVVPFDPQHTLAAGSPERDAAIRRRERDNLTSFKSGTLD